MNPTHLHYAMEVTGLSEEAILNAGKMALKREESKRITRRQQEAAVLAMQQQQQVQQHQRVQQQRVHQQQDGVAARSVIGNRNVPGLHHHSTISRSLQQTTSNSAANSNAASLNLSSSGSGVASTASIVGELGVGSDVRMLGLRTPNNTSSSGHVVPPCSSSNLQLPQQQFNQHQLHTLTAAPKASMHGMVPASQSSYNPQAPSSYGVVKSSPSTREHVTGQLDTGTRLKNMAAVGVRVPSPSLSSHHATVLKQSKPISSQSAFAMTTETNATAAGLSVKSALHPNSSSNSNSQAITKSKQQSEVVFAKLASQKKAQRAAVLTTALAKEQGKWGRVQSGLLIQSNLRGSIHVVNATIVTGKSATGLGTGGGGSSLTGNGVNMIVPMTLGGVTRCLDSRPALEIESESRIQKVLEEQIGLGRSCLDRRMKHHRLDYEVENRKGDKAELVVRMHAAAIQAELFQQGSEDGISPGLHMVNKGNNDLKIIAPLQPSFSVIHTNTTVLLLDVTDRYKRLKLQPRKESKLLEKNLRKHRQTVAESLAKRHKELNKSILSHAVDFFKFHRVRKMEISRFARSARDHVANSLKKKVKGAEMEERARIAALRSNDMGAYTDMVDDARNERLKYLLNKTDECINQISGLLKDQQQSEKEGANGDSGDCVVDHVDLDEGKVEIPGQDPPKGSYYESAHVRQEDVKQPSLLVGGKLKDYQIGGLQWLVSLYNNKLNGILADEMGLGKTVQAIALIAYLMEYKDNKGPYLVIVPLSTLSNWVNEFRRWCPAATVVVYKGTPAQRKELFKSQVRNGHFNVLLTTYEYIIKDKSSLRKLEWQYAIVDEGHRMKNAQSKFAVTLGTQYITRHRILLTGTPLQNSLPELWALLNFLLPTIFNSVETFDQWFNKPFAQFGTAINADDEEETVSTEERLLIIQRLHDLLRPFMLRRIKSDVLDQLPDKVEKVLRCELSSWQKALYKQISYSILEPDGTKRSARGLNNIVMQLRKVCNHPYMFSPEGYYITENIIRTSGKVELLDRMLPKLKAAGHRILMFFQMTAAMTILDDYFKLRNFLTLRLDGSTTGEERERRMELFNAPKSPYFIFLLSTRAGGLGLNLVSADTVIIFDSDWNPMMDLQAQDRAHRIGQKHVVSVFRLITNSPVEEKILSRATEKLNMSELVVEAGKFDKQGLGEKDNEEREQMMQLLLTDFDSTNTSGPATSSLPTSDDEEDPDADGIDNEEEDDINELLSRHDEDYDFYCKLDSGINKDDEYFESPGLITDPDDIPDWIRYPNGKKAEEDSAEDKELGKRRSANQTVTYSDGLTDCQFVRLMEQQAQAEEDAAKARKAEWKQKSIINGNAKSDTERSSNKAEKMSTEEAKPQKMSIEEAKPQKMSVKNAQSEKMLIKKVEHLKPSQNKPIPPQDDISTSIKSVEETISSQLVSITKCVIALKEPDTKRRHSDIFRKKPCKATYPDYYEMIENPIAINDIMIKCKANRYSLVKEFIADWELMFTNAKKYNGKKSWITADASTLRDELLKLMKEKNIAPEPEVAKKLRIKLSLKRVKQMEGKKESSSLPAASLKRKNSTPSSKGKKRQRKIRN